MTTYVYAWGNNPRRAELKGRRCVVEAAGAMRTVLVRFLDTGERVTTSRRALKAAPVTPERELYLSLPADERPAMWELFANMGARVVGKLQEIERDERNPVAFSVTACEFDQLDIWEDA